MKQTSVTVAAGQSQVLPITSWSGPIGISVSPTAGGTAKVEISRTDTAITNPGAALWINSDMGDITTAKEGTLYGPAIALRLSATTQPATFEIVSAT